MNIKDSYIHNGTAVLKDIKIENSVLKKILAGKDANDAYLDWTNVLDLTTIKPTNAGNADTLGSYAHTAFLKLTGGTMTGKINVSYNTSNILDDTKGLNFGQIAHIGVSDNFGIYTTGAIYLRPNQTWGSANSNGLVITSSAITYNGNSLLHAGNYTSYVYSKSTSDGRYVYKAGDTMTGALTVPSLTVTGASTFSQAINGSILGNAATASRLENARTISLTGSVTGSGSFDGSGNLSIATTTNHSHSYVNTIGISGTTITWSINGTAQTALQLPTYTNNVTSHLRVGASGATTNATSDTANPYLSLVEGSTQDSQVQLSGGTGITISAKNGIVTITNSKPDVNHNVTSHLYVGGSSAIANATSAVSDPYLCLVEGSTHDSHVQLKASTGISISANNGIVTITNTSTNSHTYTSTWTAQTANANLPIAISPNAPPATSGNGFKANFTYNPSTNTLNVPNIIASGSTSIDDATIGNLVVTGAASFAQTINGSITGTSEGITGYTFKTLNSKDNAGWSSTSIDSKIITTMSFIAYWNGAYSGTSSNLTYCNQGAFGSATTHAHTDYVTSITYDSTNRKLQQSKGGGTATDIVTFGSHAFDSTDYLPISGGTITNTTTETPLSIKGKSNYSTIQLITNNGHNRRFGVKGNNADLFVTNTDGWSNEYVIYHQGNLTTSAAASGGTTPSLVTTGDKYKWNLVYDWLTTTTADTDATINKWKELETFLTSITESDTLTGLLAQYLPLTNTATATVQFTVDDPSKMLNIKRGGSGYSMIMYSNTSSNLGMLGFTGSSVPTYRTPSGTNYTLIHSGNIGSQSVKSATYLTLNFSRGGSSPENSGEWATVKNGPTNTISNKVQFWTIYNDGGPTTYGDMLEILSRSANHWQPQLWFGSGKTGTNGSAHLYYRNKNYNSEEWGSWLTILDSGNYSSYAVAKSGGTMTGALTVPSLTVNGASSFGQAINGSILGNAATASRLQNARNIAISGAVTGNANFDGSGNITISTSVNHTHSYAGSSSAGGAATNVVVNNSDADSTYRMVWHSGNTLYSTADIYCNPNTDVLYANNLSAKAGYLFATNNGNTVSIGSQNASFCHIQNSADIPFYFNESVHVSGQFKIYGTSYKINSTTSVLNDLRVSGDDLYIGSASGSQCHLQYTSGTLKFIFD